MILKVTLMLSLALCALSDKHAAISEQKIELFTGHHGHLSHMGQQEPEHREVYAWAYPSYEFSYHVDDPHTHDMKGQHEIRDGDKVTGIYWLVQPDGRKRTVKYSSDQKNGFHADVHYEPLDGHHYELKEHRDSNHKHDESKSERWNEDHDRQGRIGIDERRHGDDDERRHDARGDKRDHNDRHHDRRSNKQDHNDKQGYEDKRGPDDKQNYGDRRHDRRNNKQGHDDKQDPGDKQNHDDRRHDRRNNKPDHDDNQGPHDKRDHDDRRHDRRNNGQDHDDRRGSDDKRDHDDKREHKNYLSAWITARKEHENDRHENSNVGIGGRRFGNRHEEHWKHGVLVGWREERDRDYHHRDNDRVRDDHYRGRDYQHRGDDKRTNDSHEGRRGHQSYQENPTPRMNFKPLIPYGHRLN